MTTQTLTRPAADKALLQNQLEQQRRAYNTDPVPDYPQRIKDLKALARMLREQQEPIIEAICADYGNRSREETLLFEIYPTLAGIKETIGSLKKWMKPHRRHTDLKAYPLSKNTVIPQPLGVVGVIVPWNFPANLSFSPLTNIFAAGNRAMVKMSTNSGHLAELLKAVSSQYFPEDKLVFIPDSGDTGPLFSSLDFDHLIFTGSSATGRAVMRSAAENLTPVTLELGGKSPAIIAPDYPIEKAAERLVYWKLMNAGQICLTVDYLFLPENTLEPFIEHAQRLANKRFPDWQSPDYTSIIDPASHQRLWNTLDDAREKGAKVFDLSAGQLDRDSNLRRFPPHLLVDVHSDMLVMQREIFGPLLPIIPYSHPEEVISYINERPRPLAIYPYTQDKNLQKLYIEKIMSGGVSINNCVLHVGQHDMPFGGVGESGMGHYHGYEGFLTFSKLRPVYHQGPVNLLKFLQPPYGKRSDALLRLMLKLTR
ncbi:coniferyl aldehyde dehydrogenase [Microbulbifer sp. 2205BS26-8]|uniref:coniferyl aldehyde dehydrogenase n=1 Tax=Microbulbifer sp. 2205BS26-8 TaxID=3064386 RepID=UPI00273FAB34|nr:coniferyl aldehyde dehydrogenase [Microbulbifer sp. 2205BS26-8]MDP5209388.1 coniferyl aldehyde dehydrogenase [Microbulbifer sp. 2205BS26-8]